MNKQSLQFWGRSNELELLRAWNEDRSQLSVLYGRRRVGKTRLVTEAFHGKKILRFEGLEGQGQREQQSLFAMKLAEYFGDEVYEQLKDRDWISLFTCLSEQIKDAPSVLFFDEFQWMAGNRTGLVSKLKYAWDNLFTESNRVHLVLCGSVSSFMINKVLKSRALYGRIDRELHLLPLMLQDVVGAFSPKRSLRDIVEIFLLVGGVPKYLELFDLNRSVQLNTVDLFFRPNAYFINEYERLFASHFGTNKHYETILQFLHKNAWSGRQMIQEKCNLKEGGRTTEYLNNLEQAGFIENYAPVDNVNAIRNSRYRISDPYLNFYFRFLHGQQKRINRGTEQNPILTFLPDKWYYPWRGYAFEKFCARHEQMIARRLGFGGIAYDAGPWYERHAAQAFQIDLAYVRSDRVMTICEIKFMDNDVGVDVIEAFQARVAKIPNPRKISIERVLITASNPQDALVNRGYFHHILTLEDIFQG